MAAERWAQVRAILESTLEQEPVHRAEFLARVCDDAGLRIEVQTLLNGLDESTSFLEGPISAAVSARAVRQEDHMVGASIGPWRLLRQIGAGGTASVYAAARGDRQFHKIVAVKIVKSGVDREEILRRFRNERQILAALDHPNITRLLDGDSTPDGLPYLVMEYVEGTPITQYCDTQKLTVTERLRLFCTVCSAVQYAHCNLVIHRDLKPANILITAQGVPKLLDFGIAKLVRPEYSGAGPLLTHTRNRMMTPAYASPEQVRGDPITTASDLYSLGVVLYELLTGQRPYLFKTDAPAELEKAICHTEPERPSTVAARLANADSGEGTPEKLSRRLRGDLDAIVLKALRKEAYRRYATADGLAEDVTRHLAGLPVGASRGTWSYRFGKFAARHRAGVVVTACSTLILIGATAVSLHFARQAQWQKELTLRIAGFAMGDLDVPSKSTSARKASLDRILSGLNQLSTDGARDPDMRALLFTGYLKAGDLQGNIYENNLGDVAAAAKSYNRALELARQPSEIAQASMRLGDVAFNQGAFRSALASYRKADELLEPVLQKTPGQPQLWLDVTRNWYRIGFMQSQLGSLREALDSYKRELELARQWSAHFPSSLEVRRELALAEEHVGSMLQQTRGAAEGLPHLERSLSVYLTLLRDDPESARCRRDVALGLFGVAGALQKLGDLRRAEQHYRDSLRWIEGLMAEDPSNEQYGRDRNSILDPMAKVLYREGQLAESRRLTESTLAALRAMVDKPAPSSYDLFQYCWDLLTTPFQDLTQPQEALRLARKAVELTRGADPGLVHVLALAWQANGDLEQAVATEGRALALYTTSETPIPGTKRAEIAANLAALQQTLSQPVSRRK